MGVTASIRTKLQAYITIKGHKKYPLIEFERILDVLFSLNSAYNDSKFGLVPFFQVCKLCDLQQLDYLGYIIVFITQAFLIMYAKHT